MPQDNQTPAAFKGWDQLFVKQGEPTPPGWTNLVDKDPNAPTAKQEFQTMLDEAGNRVSIAADKVEHAIRAGLYKAVHMVTPDGEHGDVPEHRVDDALKAGFTHAKS